MTFLSYMGRALLVLFAVIVLAIAFVASRMEPTQRGAPAQATRVFLPTFTPTPGQMATPLPTPAPLPTVTPAPPAKPIKITDVDTRVMDTEMSWNYAWKVMIRNDGDQELTVAATVYFLDADGFQIDTSYIDGDIAPHSEREFIGDERIDAELGPKVAEVIAHIDYAFIPGTLDHVQRGD